MSASSSGFRIALASIVVCVSLTVSASADAQTTLVAKGATWSYLDDGSNQGTAWQDPGFDESAWDAGPAQLGYGDGDETTLVSFGPNPGAKFITTYFRHHFNVANPGAHLGLGLSVLRDDGVVVYLNGTEVYRSNLPGGAIGFQTTAQTAIGGADEDTYNQAGVDPALLAVGDNVLAVEIHQANATSSDISFDLELLGLSTVGLARSPYLNQGTSDGIVVRWRTQSLTDSYVAYGDAPTNLNQSVTVPGSTTEHVVELSGLAADTRFYYAVGTSSQTLAGGDADHWFVTSPIAGKRQPLRVWVIGDSGQCAQSQQGCDDAGAVRDAYLDFAGPDRAQAWLLLGDNAYNSGTDQEYTDGHFAVYPEVMRNTVVWPSPGNHEFGASDSPTESGPYYDSFTMPTLAEAGGVPSGTEAYYSFDVGNVHFVALDSHDTSRAAPANPESNICPPGQGGAMYQWLCADLQSTSQDFIIAYWHHPPYTKGSHDSDDCSDSGGRMCEMRERFNPVLEAYGVDLHLSGHSHSYERSILIDGHYADSTSFNPVLHAVDPGDGDPDGDGAYAKSTLGPAANEGLVYSVVGSSSKDSGSLSGHPVMVVGVNFEGSLVIDVVGRQLDGYWIDKTGLVADHFRIEKGPALPVCSDGIDNDGDGALDHPDDPGCFDPGWAREDPQCDDGIDNDSDGGIDHDGGPGGGMPDSYCIGKAHTNRERPYCGLGFEVAPLLVALAATRRRRLWPHVGGARLR